MACPGYPSCRFTKPITLGTGAVCPKCGGDIVEKTSKRGKKFYGCANYPKCNFATWDVPTKDKCPNCGAVLLKKTGRDGKIYCGRECGYTAPLRKRGQKDEKAD